MSILVAYASKHGATQGIAERITQKLVQSGFWAQAHPFKAAGDLADYDAFIIGGAVYMGSWMKETAEFVRGNAAILATRPVWLFSSGPLGTDANDAQGRDKLVASEPKEFAEFKSALNPRGVQVFFGAIDPSRLTFPERAIRSFPAGRALMPEGDFRDWKAIEAWAVSIAHDLARVPA